MRETGVKVDANPYFGLTQDELEAVVRAGFHSRQMPEVLLALWAKEGSTRSVTSPREVPQASSAANARTIFRSTVYFLDLGTDHFIDTTRPDPHRDNVFDPSDAAAPRHETHFLAQVRALVQARFLSEDISGAINAELTVARNPAGKFTVLPSVRFYALSLLLADAFFTQLQETSFPQLSFIPTALNYLHWNMGPKRFREFLASADQHRREPAHAVNGGPISIEQWALHTKPKSNEWAQPRRNAIRFLHFLDSYRPVFANAITLIKPGIEDLQNVTSRTASASGTNEGATTVTLDDRRHGGTLPYREAVEMVNHAAWDAVARWQSVLAGAQARMDKALTPRVPFDPLPEFDRDETHYQVLQRAADFQEHRRKLKAAWEKDLNWLFDLNLSAVAQIEDEPTRKRLLEKVDWTKVVYVGKEGNSAPAAELFNEMAKLVPERRVPQLVPLINVDQKVVTVPGTTEKLFPAAKDAFVRIRDAAAATHPPGGTTAVSLVLVSGWRSEKHQADIAAKHPNRAAVAGKRSAHRYGLAADLNLSVSGLKITEISTASMPNILFMYRSPVYKWLFLYGAQFGWYPYRNEPWHWEYNPPGFPERFRDLAKV